jgi:nucleoside-diphosphate-sugar epimerase
MRTIVFGASGFVGSALVERLRSRGDDFVAVIHSAGNAWRLARHGLPLKIVDITSRTAVAEVMRGCTHVVNCTRGGDDVMITGLKNLLAEAKMQGVKRFVHVSSVAVYGDPPPASAEHEASPAKPAPGSYGDEKLKQDVLVEKAHDEGLPSATLCPPNISGVYSTFVCNVLEDIRNGSFALVDEGKRPLNIVDVENLCHAIELAGVAERVDGRRIFVTDGDAITWAAFAKHLMGLAERDAPLRSVASGQVARAAEEKAPKLSAWRAMKHLVSSDVRAALRKDPLLARMDAGARAAVARLGRSSEDSLRYSIEGPTRVAKVPTDTAVESRYNGQQLRGVTHRNARARQMLDYRPIIDFDASMANFAAWFRATRGMDAPSWPLVRELL